MGIFQYVRNHTSKKSLTNIAAAVFAGGLGFTLGYTANITSANNVVQQHPKYDELLIRDAQVTFKDDSGKTRLMGISYECGFLEGNLDTIYIRTNNPLSAKANSFEFHELGSVRLDKGISAKNIEKILTSDCHQLYDVVNPKKNGANTGN